MASHSSHLGLSGLRYTQALAYACQKKKVTVFTNNKRDRLNTGDHLDVVFALVFPYMFYVGQVAQCFFFSICQRGYTFTRKGEEEKHHPMGYGHTTISSLTILQPVGILETYVYPERFSSHKDQD